MGEADRPPGVALIAAPDRQRQLPAALDSAARLILNDPDFHAGRIASYRRRRPQSAVGYRLVIKRPVRRCSAPLWLGVRSKPRGKMLGAIRLDGAGTRLTIRVDGGQALARLIQRYVGAPAAAMRWQRAATRTRRALALPHPTTLGLKLAAHAEAVLLLDVGQTRDGAALRLEPQTAAAWLRLKRAAASEGQCLQPVSGFRSLGHQRAIIERKRRAGQAWSQILNVNAAPGFSEHHSGRAMDVLTADYPQLDAGFASTEGWRWLSRRAADFGFRLSYPQHNGRGVVFEPWHWFYSRRSTPWR